MASMMEQQQQQREQQHAWEQTDAAQMWSSVQEDADGNLLNSSHQRDAAALVRLRRRRLARSDGARSHRRLVRDMIRYVYVVLDCSHVMYERDPALPGGGQTRFDVVLNVLSAFVQEYYDQNPLSQLGLVVVRDGEAEMVTRLTGSRTAHGAALVRLRRDVGRSVASDPHGAGGVFSLQNGLEVAGRSLGHMPRYGSREVLVVLGGLATCDPGDVLADTLPRLKAAGVRVSTVALQAEVHVCRRIADATGGVLGVCLDRGHLRDLILGQCTPPPAKPGEDETRRRKKCAFVQMGFPPHRTDDVPSLVHAGSSRGGSSDTHRALLVRRGYVCPQCRAKTAELPADCAVCGLKLVLAPHLARSFHHLFPVPPFAEVAEEVDVARQQQHEHDDAAADGSSGCDDQTAPPAPPAAAADVIGSAPPSSVAADAAVTSSAPTFEVVSSRGTAATAAAAAAPSATTRTVRIDAKLLVTSRECDRCCFACLKIIGVHRPAQQPADAATASATKKRKTTESVVTAASSASASASASALGVAAAGSDDDPHVLLADRPEPLRFQCPDCRNVFCADCDAYLHETLHNCPGCLCA